MKPPFQRTHGEERAIKETFQIYAHEEHDEECDWHAESEAKRTGIPEAALRDFFYNNPLYEVAFDVEYDHETGEFEIVAARSNGWTLIRRQPI